MRYIQDEIELIMLRATSRQSYCYQKRRNISNWNILAHFYLSVLSRPSACSEREEIIFVIKTRQRNASRAADLTTVLRLENPG